MWGYRSSSIVALALAFAVACGGSKGASPGSGGTGDQSGASSGSSGSGSGGPSGSNGGGSGGDDTTGSEDASSSGSPSIDTSGWACPSGDVFGGYSSVCVDCLEAMCTSQLTTCMTMSCADCEGPVFQCETAMCEGPCTDGGTAAGGSGGTGSSGAGSSGTGSGGSGGTGSSSGAATGSCATLMGCCTLIAEFEPMYASTCTSAAASGNQATCAQILAMVPSDVQGLCQ